MRPAAWPHRRAFAGILVSLLSLSCGSLVAANQPPESSAPAREETFAEVHNKAVSLFLQRRHEDALREFSRAISIDPSVALAFYNRANVRMALKDETGAIEDYTQAIRLRQDFGLAYMNRGSAYSNIKRLDEAKADLDEAVRLEPALPDAFYNRAVVLIKRAEIPAAMADYEQMVKLDRSDTDSRADDRLEILLKRKDAGHASEGSERLISELSHGRKTEYLLALLGKACLEAGFDETSLSRVASKEGWTPIPAERLQKERGSERLVAGWSHRFLESIYYVIQSRPDERQLVCSVSAMPVSDHMLEDFKASLEDRFKVMPSVEIKAQDRVESRYTLQVRSSPAEQDLQVVHRKSARFVTLRAVHQSP